MKISALKPGSASRLTQGYLICLLGTFLWAFTAIFIRYLTEVYHLPPLVLAFWRDLFVFIALASGFAIFNPARLRIERRHLGFLVLYGFILSVFNSLWTASVALNGAAVATVLAYSSAAFTAIIGWRIFGEKLGVLKILAVSLSLVGCLFVSGAYSPATWRLNPAGIITGLLSGVFFASYTLMGRASARRGLYPWTTLFYTFGIAAFFLLIYNLAPALFPGFNHPLELFWLGDSGLGWAILIALAVGPTIGGYGFYTLSLTYLPASVANLIATLEPPLTAVLAFLILGEHFTAAQWIGSAMIISGLFVLRKGEGQTLQPE